jgi:hypothetical protein
VPRATVQGPATARAINAIRTTAGAVLSPDQIERLESQGTRERLQNELTKQLVTAGRFGENGALQLSLEITEFRLRTESGVRWVGAMAGPDVLGVKVRVAKNGVEVDTFETGVSTTVGTSWQYAYEVIRLERMIAELSRRIIAKLGPP